jgi:hypothetical protein
MAKRKRALALPKAKRDSKTPEATPAPVASFDDYAEWLLAQRGTVSPDLDLEF